MLSKAEKRALRKFRHRSTVTMSEERFEKVVSSGLFYPVLKPGRYSWGGSGSVKVRLTDAGERALEECRAEERKSFFKIVGAVLSSAVAIITIIKSLIE